MGKKGSKRHKQLPDSNKLAEAGRTAPIIVTMAFLLLLITVVTLARPMHTRTPKDSTTCQDPTIYQYEVVESYPHDPDAFTQGLQYDQECKTEPGRTKETCTDILWESTGMYRQSTVRKVELATGRVLAKQALKHSDFAEGLTRLGDRLYQLTWLQPTVYSYHINDFSDVKRMSTQLKDGWGLTTNGNQLLVTDSSDTLFFLDPKTLKTKRNVTIQDAGKKVKWVNEIEWVNGQVWGMVWQTDCLVHIDPESGRVVGWAVMEGLAQRAAREAPSNSNKMDVLNGVAWDDAKDRLFVTGKYWPRLFEVKLKKVTATGGAKAELLANVRSRCIM